MDEILNDNNWTEWKPFPDPRKEEYLFAPFGFGIYQQYDNKKKKYLLFGRGKNVAFRMTTLLPLPEGQGTRKKTEKKDYVLKNLKNIKYRTMALKSKLQCIECERKLKALRIHIFNEIK